MINDILKPKSRKEIEGIHGFNSLLDRFNITTYGNPIVKEIKLDAFLRGGGIEIQKK